MEKLAFRANVHGAIGVDDMRMVASLLVQFREYRDKRSSGK